MDYLGAVNRVLVNAFILKGDDDLIVNFTGNQHEATIRVAKNAIQTELDSFLSFFQVDYEKTTGEVVTVASQRTITLPSDFVRFWNDNPFLYLNTDASRRLYEWHGGENHLRQQDQTYLTNEGVENWWYWDSTTVKSIAFFQVPNAVRTWKFDYAKNVSVVNGTDPIPLHSEQESRALIDMASRRFSYMIDKERDLSNLESDREYSTSYGTLMNLIRHKNPRNNYRKVYR